MNMIYLRTFAVADVKSRDMNNMTRARLIIIFILTHFITGSLTGFQVKNSGIRSMNCFSNKNSRSVVGFQLKNSKLTFIYRLRNEKKIKAEKKKYRREFIEENEKYREKKVKIAEIKKYYEAMMKQIVSPVEDYINKTKGEARSPLPNNESIKGSQDVLVPTPEETIAIIFVAYLGFWISVGLKVCNMAYELSGENKKIADQCDVNFEIMQNAVDSVFRDFLPRFRSVSKTVEVKYYSSEEFTRNITVDEIATELSCLDLKFVIKATTSDIKKQNRNCPFNIIEWEKMNNNKWRHYFSTEYIQHQDHLSTMYFISEIHSALIRVINLIGVRNVQRYFSALLNCKTNALIIDEVRDRYFPFNHYTKKNFIDAIIEKKLEKTANPTETLLSVVKKWVEIDMEQLERERIQIE